MERSKLAFGLATRAVCILFVNLASPVVNKCILLTPTELRRAVETWYRRPIVFAAFSEVELTAVCYVRTPLTKPSRRCLGDGTDEWSLMNAAVFDLLYRFSLRDDVAFVRNTRSVCQSFISRNALRNSAQRSRYWARDTLRWKVSITSVDRRPTMWLRKK